MPRVAGEPRLRRVAGIAILLAMSLASTAPDAELVTDAAAVLLLALLIFTIWKDKRTSAGEAVRSSELRRLASRMGLRLADRASVDPNSFAVFRKHGWFSNMMFGKFRGRSVFVSDWSFAPGADDPQRSSYVTLSVARARVARLPYCSIRRRKLGGLSAHLDRDMGTALEFELETFNRAFVVRADDAEFAHALVDARMIEWLMDQREDLLFESGKAGVCIVGPRIPARDYEAFTITIAEFADHVPKAVAKSYEQASTGPLLRATAYPPGARFGNALAGSSTTDPLHIHELTLGGLRGSPYARRLLARILGRALALAGALLVVCALLYGVARMSGYGTVFFLLCLLLLVGAFALAAFPRTIVPPD